MTYNPKYLSLSDKEFSFRIESLYKNMQECDICPHECGVNRYDSLDGKCGSGVSAKISSAFPHFGEEAPLVGGSGSGTIFFTSCNLKCIFCQNFDISHHMEGEAVTEERIAEIMLVLQQSGCLNINFVTPTHFCPQMVKAIYSAKMNGLTIPVVYNCGGYENIRTLKLLDGIIDIYMPDLKFATSEIAAKYTNASNYADRSFEAVAEMHRQVGDLQVEEGKARCGLMIRHLVMPGHPGETEKILSFIAEKLSKDSYVNIMGQYRPCFKASNYMEIDREPEFTEMQLAYRTAGDLGLHRGF